MQKSQENVNQLTRLEYKSYIHVLLDSPKDDMGLGNFVWPATVEVA